MYTYISIQYIYLFKNVRYSQA